MTTKRPADHVLDLLGELDAAHELEALAKRPIEELDARLRAMGVEPADVDAVFEKVIGSLDRPAEPAAPAVPVPPAKVASLAEARARARPRRR